jgi:hypothetical protein
MRFRSAILTVALFLGGAAPEALGQVKSVQRFDRPMRLDRQDDRLVASFDCPEVFSDWVRQRLGSGFTSRVVINLQLLDRKGEALLGQGVVQYTIRYDIWEERFAVRVEGMGARRNLLVSSLEELVKRFGTISQMPIIQLIDLAGAGQVQLVARVVVNPTSPELRKKVREYVANPDGRREIGTPRSFFGSFSRIFVNEKKIQADAVLIFRSGTLDMPVAKPAGT